jgi:hypothetical protein
VFAEQLPEILQRYVKVVESMPARTRCFAVLGRVAEELRIDLDGTDRVARGGLDGETMDRVLTLFDGFEMFLSGIEHKAAVDLDLARLKEAAGHVRGRLRNPEGREVLARFEGILATYQPLATPALRASPGASADQVRAFIQLLEDREYDELARTTLELGLPARSRRAVQVMRRRIDGLLTRAPFKQAFNLGAQTITAATQVPVPDSEAAHALLGAGYLPPTFMIDEAMAEAAKRWRDAAPKFIPFPAFESGHPAPRVRRAEPIPMCAAVEMRASIQRRESGPVSLKRGEYGLVRRGVREA